MTSTFNNIVYETSDGIATITLNRPDKMNTFSIDTMLEFVAAIDATDADDDVRVVIITGAGNRAFCAGADLSQGAATFDYASQGRDRERLMVNGIYRDWGGWMSLRLFNSLKPIIAAVNGAAAGIGATLQTAMDIRLASTTAKYAFPFTRRGIVPEAGSTWFLPHIVGLPTALEWCFTGRQISAVEARDRGLVRSLHEPDDLMPAAREIAREIVDNTSPISVALTRQLLWRLAGAAHPMAAHMADSRAVHFRGPTADTKEGIASFLEKRKPHFPGKVSDGLPDIFPSWVEPEFH
ncbi:enoyl-CoA hydratase (plasmid) [Sphingomonas paeninsulae]|jgi:enoyl-CoA hydratase/carnithine racemase|uniref:Enoyl-CoA hydratase n=1 Tax=Sphingomonas paeninsulae TaxID=2319844 RepID=A0A494TCU1_SPHPE|nr:enoyl-CoA hydratase-related protein [Sphingomonas paeninsulae]AYJ84903.1 enoyl-CoA hydratase [Sphingomonas paeninsulae]